MCTTKKRLTRVGVHHLFNVIFIFYQVNKDRENMKKMNMVQTSVILHRKQISHLSVVNKFRHTIQNPENQKLCQIHPTLCNQWYAETSVLKVCVSSWIGLLLTKTNTYILSRFVTKKHLWQTSRRIHDLFNRYFHFFIKHDKCTCICIVM